MPNPLYIYIYIYIYIWFGWVLCHINHCKLFDANLLYTYIYIRYIWFGWVFCHIHHCRLFNAKSSLYIYIWFGWVLCHINHCKLFDTNLLYTYIYIRYIWFGWVFCHIHHCRLFNAKSSLYIYRYDLVGFHAISIIVSYLIQIFFIHIYI